MSSERDMRKRVVRILKPLHAVSIENGVGMGTPDVNFVGGWIELKSMPRWPMLCDTILRVEHWTPSQKLFHRQRAKAGGKSWVLLKVENDWLLFKGEVAADILGESAESTLKEKAFRIWAVDGLHEADFLETMRTA